MKKFLATILLTMFCGVALAANGPFKASEYLNKADDIFKRLSTGAILPAIVTDTIGNSANRITEIWVDTLDATTATIAAVITGALTVDVTDPEALLVRKNGDTGDIFTVDTTNSQIQLLATGVFGTAPNPTLSFGDGDTGFYESADDNLDISIGGSEAMRIDESGNVGIGTTTPQEKLHVVGNLILQDGLFDIGVKSGEKMQFGIWNADWSTFSTNMVIDNVGNVGIGTATPASKLDVAGTIRAQEICDENGANCRDISNGELKGGIFVAVSAASTGSAAHDAVVGYQAANDLCNTASTGSHVCSVDEVLNTVNNITDLSALSGWSVGGTTQVWVNSGGAKYAPDDTPVADCNGWSNATVDNLGSFWILNSTGGGSAGVGYCNTSKVFACCEDTYIPTCGEDLTYGGETYGTVKIGNQCWMGENLNVGTMINSTSGGDGSDGESANNSTIEKYCYSNDEANCTAEGGLYQWDEAMAYATAEGSQGICADGWHMPTDAEQNQLDQYLTDAGNTCVATRLGWDCDTAGTKLKTGGTSGFEGLLTGYRRTDSSFYNQGTGTSYWSSSESGTNAWRRHLNSSNSTVYRGTLNKGSGFSVRCLKN